MGILRFIPFINEKEVNTPRQGEHVRYLAKFNNNARVNIDRFNYCVGKSLAQMNESKEGKKAKLRSGIRKDLDQDYLQRNHLSYEIKLESESEDGGESKSGMGRVTGKTSFSVILREQPSKAIEISGPKLVASRYKRSMEKVLEEEGIKAKFQNVVND